MSSFFTENVYENPDRILRMLDLAGAKSSASDNNQDLVVLVENNGTVIEGECKRQFADGKKRLDALGYMLGGSTVLRTDFSGTNLVQSDLIVVRQSDAATASLWSLYKSQTSTTNLKVQLSVFKAGGDNSPDAQPTLEIVLSQARVTAISALTSTTMAVPCEIVFFLFGCLEIRSAPQLAQGQRGAVRTCTIDLSLPAVSLGQS